MDLSMRQTRLTTALPGSWIPVCLAFALALLAGCGTEESKQAQAPQATTTRAVAAVPAPADESATGESAAAPGVASPVSDDQPTTATSAVADAASSGTLAAGSDTVADGIPPGAPRLILSGRVTMADSGTPVEGAKIELSKIDYSNRIERKNLVAGSATTSADGHYRITVQDGSQFRVSASKSGAGTVVDRLPHEFEAGSGGRIRGAREVKKDFALTPAAAVSGTVVDESDKPVAGVKVVACARAMEGRSPFPTYLPRSDVQTDAEGRFRFDDVPTGWVGLSIHSDEYIPLDEEVEAPKKDVVLRLLTEGATLSGHVYLKSTGAAVSGAKVVLFESGKPAFRLRSRQRELETGVDGSYVFDRLPAGGYGLSVTKPPLRPVPGENAQSNRIVLPAKEKKLDLDYFLYEGATIRGRVTLYETREPLEGVVVKQAWGGGLEKKEATTGPNGEYVLTGLEGSQISLNVEKKGYRMARLDRNMRDFVEVSFNAVKNDVTQNFEMIPAARVSGTVKTESGAPVANAQVRAYTSNGSSGDRKTPVEADGTYTLDVEPRSSLRVRAEAPGYPIGVSDVVTIEEAPVNNVDVVMKAGCTVSGRVTAPDGKPAAGATVDVMATVQIGHSQIGEGIKTVTADESGAFRIDDLPGMEIGLTARKDGYAPTEPERITLSPGEVKTGVALQLGATHFIAGRVTDPEGKPIVDASVFANSFGFAQKSSQGHAQTDNDGRYRIEGLAAAKHQVSAACPDYGSVSKESVTVDRDDVDFVLEFQKRVSLIGTVIDRTTREPIVDFAVEGQNVETDRATPGRFTMKGLRAGISHSMQISAPGYADSVGVSVFVPEDVETFEKTFEMGKGGTVTGRVVEKSSGNPVAGVRVFLRGMGDRWMFPDRTPLATAITGDDGRFRFTGVSVGKNQFEFRPAAPLVQQTQSADVKENETTDMGDVGLTGGGVVRVRVVTDPGEAPQPGVAIELHNQTDWTNVRSATTDAAGTVEFTSVLAGSHTVSAPTLRLQSYFKLADGEPQEIVMRVGTATVKGRTLRGGKGVQAGIHLLQMSDKISNNTQSGSDGAFEITGLAPGSYMMNAMIMENTNERVQTQSVVELTAAQTLVKDLVFPDGRIVGRVVDAAGNPVSGASVCAQSPALRETLDPSRATKSEDNGAFTLGGLVGGSYSVTAAGADHGMAVRDGVEVPADGESAPVELRIDTSNGGTIISVVLNMEGQPVEKAWCNLTSRGGGNLMHRARRGEDGAMKIVGIPPGTYDMEVSGRIYSVVSRAIEVKAGETQAYEDVLYEAGNLLWRLEDKNGVGLAGVRCAVAPKDPTSIEEPRSGETNARGEVLVRGLLPGEYTGTAALPDGRGATDTFTIRAGELTNTTTSAQ